MFANPNVLVMRFYHAYPINEVHDLNLEFLPSTGMYTLFPSLSHIQIVVWDDCFMCCCYDLRTSLFATCRTVYFWSKKGYQWSSKFVCSLCLFRFTGSGEVVWQVGTSGLEGQVNWLNESVGALTSMHLPHVCIKNP